MATTRRLLKAATFATACLLSGQFARPLGAIAQTTPTPKAPPNCLSGYPDGTYRGDQALTRDEYAAGMNACLEQIRQERLNRLQPNRANLATREDFQVLIERQRELNQQLRQLSDRVGDLADPKPKPVNP